MFIRASTRAAASLLAALALLLAMALPAAAHVTIVDGDAVPADGSAVISFRLPHGCDGEPVDALSVQLPDGIVGAKPEAMPGWTISTKMVQAEYELYGTSYTERVGTIRWEGGPVPDNQFLDFRVNATFQLEPGEYPIPVVQACGEASVGWTQVAAEGQDADELDTPAPILTVVEGDGGGHGSGGQGASGSEPPTTGGSPDGDGDLAARIAALEAAPASATAVPVMPLTIAALVSGLAGLVLGALAFRRRA